jgi:hypothetical protein
MKPKEKAIELIGKFNFTHDKINGKFLFHQNLDESKRCALIALDELIEFAYNYTDYNEKLTKEYLEKVKHEIENL